MNRIPTRLPSRCRRLGLCSALVLLLGACNHAPAANVATGAATGAAPLLTRIEKAIGQPVCQQDSECRTLAVGQKSCGGPEAWLPWSTRTVSTPAGQDALAELARQHAQARDAENRASGRMSICSMLPDPGASCQASRCVLREASPADAAMQPR